MRKLIRTDGTEQDLPEPLSMDAVCQLIGAKILEYVPMKHLGAPAQGMLVDSHAHVYLHSKIGWNLVALKPGQRPNAKATELYRPNAMPGSQQHIIGDVVVCPRDEIDQHDEHLQTNWSPL